jgi:hypothetical protein
VCDSSPDTTPARRTTDARVTALHPSGNRMAIISATQEMLL